MFHLAIELGLHVVGQLLSPTFELISDVLYPLEECIALRCPDVERSRNVSCDFGEAHNSHEMEVVAEVF